MKTRIKIMACVVALLAGTAGLLAQSGAEPAAGLFEYQNPESVARGADIYEASCAACHGADLEGQANWRTERSGQGRALAPPHDETGHTWHHPDRQLFQIVKFGTAALVGGDYESDMIGFSETLSDEEILDVMAFIKSTWPADVIEQHNAINAVAKR